MSSSESDLAVPDLKSVCDTTVKLDLTDEETAITEISFLPDGRICVFGASLEVLDVLGSLNLGDERLNARLAAANAPKNVDGIIEAGAPSVTEFHQEAVQVHE